jgi:hypothetical protein
MKSEQAFNEAVKIAGIDYGSKLAGTTAIAALEPGGLSFWQSKPKQDADRSKGRTRLLVIHKKASLSCKEKKFTFRPSANSRIWHSNFPSPSLHSACTSIPV